MHIGTVLNFHRFMRRLYEPPKLALDVILCHTHVTKYSVCDVFRIRIVRFRGMRLKPPPAEFAVACLKARQRVLLALVKTEVPPSTDYASGTKPLPTWHGC